ncbi:MAG: radical SAM protein [Actinobacteria bacterium]|nr:radical SAM protein [Actinomycetota bacterium]MCL5883245.1 radical SAM protein [Actinomycetota bacterium]
MKRKTSIPPVDYQAFSKRVHESVRRDRIPVGGSLDLTSRCNLRCVHCYVRDTDPSGELGTGEIKRILDELAEAGCLWMLFTGGEPLLRSDFRELYGYAKQKGFLVNLFTNATLVTPDLADFLGGWPPFSIEISIYGATRDTYEKVTGVKGSFDKCMAGIELLHRHGLPLKLKSMILTLNQHELTDMMEMAAKFGAEFRYDPNIHGRVDGSSSPVSFRLSPEEVLQLDFIDRRRIGALKKYVDYCKQYDRDDVHAFHCGAGIDSFHIDAEGRLCLCMLARRESFDLRQGSFMEGWNGLIREMRYRENDREYACGACELLEMCGQCPGWGEVENGDQLKGADFLCRLAHLRQEAYESLSEWDEDKSSK